MTSGTPLSKDEQQYIRDHLPDGPARIAYALKRKKITIKAFIRRDRQKTEEILELALPVAVLKEAGEKGISPDHIRFVAIRAILQRVKAT